LNFLEGYIGRFRGIAALYGFEGLRRLCDSRVCLIGVGGVGSWAAESLARSGVGHLTLVDSEAIELGNINRQLHTLTSTVGRGKAEVLGERLMDINPELDLSVRRELLTKENVSSIITPETSAVSDAIDSVPDKAALIAYCVKNSIPVISAGGAGGRTDPSKIVSVDLGLSANDRLASCLRTELRSRWGFPKGAGKKFGVTLVHSTESAVLPKSIMSETEYQELTDIYAPDRLRFGQSMAVTASVGLMVSAEIIKILLGAQK